MAWVTFMTAEVDTPAYNDSGERANLIAPIRFSMLGVTTEIDLLMAIVKLYDTLEEDYDIKTEDAKEKVEQMMLFREDKEAFIKKNKRKK